MSLGRFTSACLFAVASFCAVAAGQRVAVISPNGLAPATSVADRLAEGLPKKFRVIDRAAAESAFSGTGEATPFNMPVLDARNAAAVIGCDVLILIRADSIRRVSLERDPYFESYAAIYVINGRTGELAAWLLKNAEAPTEQASLAGLINQLPEAAGGLENSISSAALPIGRGFGRFDDHSGDPAVVPPIPYRRLKPEYTRTAYLYGIRATVDIEVSIDASGSIIHTNVVRWAGFGLDEAAVSAVRAMNWRPAMRDSKPLPTRVLLRYNFTKIDKE